MEKVLLYKIDIISSALVFDLKINDIRIGGEKIGGSLSTIFSINEWLSPGPNELKIEFDQSTLPFTNQSMIDIKIGTANTHEEDIQTQLVHFKEDDFIKNPQISLSRPFAAGPLNQTMPLLDLPIIDLTKPKYMEQLYDKMELLYMQFQDKNMESILSMCDFSLREIDRIYGDEPGRLKKEVTRILQNSFENDVLLLFKKEKLKPSIHAYGKLLSLEYHEHGLPAINTSYNNFKSTRSFKYYWALNEDDQLFIFR